MAKILIVDDAQLARRMMRSILAPEGHEIIEAADGYAALEQYHLSAPDLVLLDMIMSDMQGIDVLHKLLELDPQARIIMATADIQTSTYEMAREAGASAFVTKPYNRDEVLSAVDQVLRGGDTAW